MKIYATGNRSRIEELKDKMGSIHEVIAAEDGIDTALLESSDILFHLNSDDSSSPLTFSCENKLIVLCSVKKQLREQAPASSSNFFVGFNALPSFINRSKMEVSFLDDTSRKKFTAFAQAVNVYFLQVEDQIGMVTPRVIFMIINEACYSLYEGVASQEDIDKAMKLGTNYPLGPFEWCDKIGIKDVFETLLAIRDSTHDLRYEICPLLKEKYLKKEPFYF